MENKNSFEWFSGFLWGLIPGIIIGAALYKHYKGL
jgi:hypothetical protein